MPGIMRLLAAIALLGAASPALVGAQASGAGPSFELWGGMARNSPTLGVLGKAGGMNLGLLGLRFAWKLGGEGAGRWARNSEFHVDVIPVAMMSPPWVSRRGTGWDCPANAICVKPRDPQESLFPDGSSRGSGINPAGVTTRLWSRHRVSATIGVTAGALRFDRPVPTTAGSRFNFTAALEAGLRIGAARGTSLSVSYRFHHVSSAGLAIENPGVASHIIGASLRLAPAGPGP
jgi:hypothetical protein